MSDINDGYPVRTEAGMSEPYDYTKVYSAWALDSDINDGYPYISKLYDGIIKWIEPVTDRTRSDIINAINLLNNKKRNHSIDFEFTKAFLNYYDLNRIENNTKFLADLLGVKILFNIHWRMDDVPKASDRLRLLQNMAQVLEKFRENHSDDGFPEIPTKLSNYLDFNQLEHVQLAIYEEMFGEDD